jgi:hypothetical protein
LSHVLRERFKIKYSSKDFQFNKKAGRKKRDSASQPGNNRQALLETVKLIQKWEVPDSALPLQLRSTFNPEKDQPEGDDGAVEIGTLSFIVSFSRDFLFSIFFFFLLLVLLIFHVNLFPCNFYGLTLFLFPILIFLCSL